MENAVSVVRTEKKYSITRSQKTTLMHRLEQIMKTDPLSGMDGYSVRSLYFDSIYDNDYFDKKNGLEFRKKIRLRIYSPDQESVKLELKQKQGAAQQKKSLIISRRLAQAMAHGKYSGLLELDSKLAIELYLIMTTGAYRPKCIVEYHRVAFAEDSNNIRVTFDSNIGVSFLCDQFFAKDLSLIPARAEPVLEVKYNNFLLSEVRQALDFADAPEIAISKYAMSCQILGM